MLGSALDSSTLSSVLDRLDSSKLGLALDGSTLGSIYLMATAAWRSAPGSQFVAWLDARLDTQRYWQLGAPLLEALFGAEWQLALLSTHSRRRTHWELPVARRVRRRLRRYRPRRGIAALAAAASDAIAAVSDPAPSPPAPAASAAPSASWTSARVLPAWCATVNLCAVTVGCEASLAPIHVASQLHSAWAGPLPLPLASPWAGPLPLPLASPSPLASPAPKPLSRLPQPRLRHQLSPRPCRWPRHHRRRYSASAANAVAAAAILSTAPSLSAVAAPSSLASTEPPARMQPSTTLPSAAAASVDCAAPARMQPSTTLPSAATANAAAAAAIP